MDRGKGEHRNRASEHREKSAPGASEPRPQSGCRLNGRREHSRALGSWCVFVLLRRVDAQFLDEPRGRIQHLELDAAWVVHTLATCRDAAGKREDEAAARVDVLFLFGGKQVYAETLLERLDRRARVGDEAVTRILADQRLLGHI